MNINYSLFFFIILLLLLNYRSVNGFNITDVTVNPTKVKYANTVGQCNFSFDILCVPTPSESCSSIVAVETKGLYPVSSFPIINNGTLYLNTISISTNYGQYAILVQGNYVIDIQCLTFNLQSVRLNPTSDYYSVLNIDSTTTTSVVYYNQIVFQVDGINSSIPLDYKCLSVVGSPIDCSIIQYGYSNNKFLLYCKPFPTNWDLNTVQIQITSNSNSLTLPLDTSSFKRDYYSITDIKTYPGSSSLQGLSLFGYNQYPIVSFKMNSTIDKSLFYIVENSGTYSIIYPSNSDDTGTSYYLPLKENFDLYYLTGSNIVKLSNSNQIKTTINQYPISKLTSYYSQGYWNDMPLLFYKFSDNKPSDLPPIKISFNYGTDSFITQTRFPFGYTLVNNTGYNFEFNTMIKSSFTSSSITAAFILPDLSIMQFNIYPLKPVAYSSSLKPMITGFKIFNLEYDLYLYRVNISTPYIFNYIKNSNRHIGSESLISGNTNNGTLEFIRTKEKLELFDQYQGLNTYTYNSIISLNEMVERFTPPIYNFKNLDDISQVSYLFNNIDVTNRRVYNIFYFNYSNPNVPRDTVFRLVPNSNYDIQSYDDVILGSTISFPSTWNQTLKLFQIEFYTKENSPLGSAPFILVYNNDIKLYSQNLNTQLIIKKTNFDNQGPIFKDIIKIEPTQINNTNLIGYIGWIFTIEDEINGFEYGYVTIKNDNDHSSYNVTFNIQDIKSGNKYLGTYDIRINISFPCISSSYSISKVKLYDSMKRVSVYSNYPEQDYFILNPFINYLNNSSINKIQIECASDPIALDTTPPELLSFTVSLTEIDVSTTLRQVSFDFIAKDQESNLKDYQYPIVYLGDSNNHIIECKSNITNKGSSSFSYSCSIELPLAFGYPGNITLSIYGFINNAGLVSGYSTKNLFDIGFQNNIKTKFETNQPVITSYNQFTEKSTSIWIYGRGLDNTIKAYIQYSDLSNEILYPTMLYPTAIQISNINSTNKPLQIYIETSNDQISNKIIVTPILFNYYLDVCNGNGIPNKIDGYCICNNKWTTLQVLRQCMVINHYISSSSQVSSIVGGEIYLYGYFGDQHLNQSLYINSQLANIVTITSNSIKTTIGSGNIGGVQVSYSQNGLSWSGIVYPYYSNVILCPSKCEENGICDKSGECICNLGYSGIDCQSPITPTNGSDTSSNTNVNNNGTTIIKNQDIGYLISIDSISEIDFNNNIVSTFNLSNNWIYVNKLLSITTFKQIKNNKDETNSTISLIIEEVNDQDKEFNFAGNQFTVSKGGFKLSLSISNWQYQSNLNTLQIQISSDIQIDNNDNNCNKDNNNLIIESSSNNNYLSNNINYLKVIKNNRSFYARFQDKMLSDNRSTTIITQLLKSNSINNNNNIKVLINLPRCNECLIDPDFSLLITSNYKFNCDSNMKKWVVAVSIVVSVVGALVLSILIITIYKKSTFLKIRIYSIKKKLKIIN